MQIKGVFSSNFAHFIESYFLVAKNLIGVVTEALLWEGGGESYLVI